MAAETGRLRAHITKRLSRLDGPSRLPGLDLARGLAIVGMFAAHLLTIDDWSWTEPATWLDVVNGRSSITFATLAGISLTLLYGRASHTSTRAVDMAAISVRAVLIWVLGMVLVVLQTPVLIILPAYAILFLLAGPLVWRPRRFVVGIAVLAGIAGPFFVAWLEGTQTLDSEAGEALVQFTGWHYPFVVWIAFVAIGIVMGRVDLRSPAWLAIVALFGAGVSLAGYGVGSYGNEDSEVLWQRALSAAPHSSGIGEVFGSGGLAVAVIAICLLLCLTPLRWLVWPLRAMGSMPLSAYAAHLVVWAIWRPAPSVLTPDLIAFRELEPFWPMTLGIVVACCLWAIVVGRGPCEWLVATVVARVTRSMTGTRDPRLEG